MRLCLPRHVCQAHAPVYDVGDESAERFLVTKSPLCDCHYMQHGNVRIEWPDERLAD